MALPPTCVLHAALSDSFAWSPSLAHCLLHPPPTTFLSPCPREGHPHIKIYTPRKQRLCPRKFPGSCCEIPRAVTVLHLTHQSWILSTPNLQALPPPAPGRTPQPVQPGSVGPPTSKHRLPYPSPSTPPQWTPGLPSCLSPVVSAWPLKPTCTLIPAEVPSRFTSPCPWIYFATYITSSGLFSEQKWFPLPHGPEQEWTVQYTD